MTGLESIIPGLTGAEERYREAQSEAFLGIAPTIGGLIPLKPFTPQMYIELEAAGNACVTGTKTPQFTDLVQFLWRCSESFTRKQKNPKKVFRFWQFVCFRSMAIEWVSSPEWLSFIRRCSLLDYVDTVRAVDSYVVHAWSGQPHWKVSSGESKSAGIWPSMLVHTLAKEYGWTDERILNTPFRLIWQYMHRIMEGTNPDYRHFCAEAMALRNDYLNNENARLKTNG